MVFTYSQPGKDLIDSCIKHPETKGRQIPEESIWCPASELDLWQNSAASSVLSLHPTLPSLRLLSSWSDSSEASQFLVLQEWQD